MTKDNELRIMRAMARIMPNISGASDYHALQHQLSDIEERARNEADFDIAAAVERIADMQSEAQTAVYRARQGLGWTYGDGKLRFDDYFDAINHMRDHGSPAEKSRGVRVWGSM